MKTVLLTGVAGGMGYATAKQLIRDGAAVIGLDVHAPAPVAGLTFLQVDLTDPAAVEAASAQLAAQGVRLDAIVHHAGVYALDSLVEMDESAFRRVFEINLFAAWRVNRSFLPLLAPGGRIVLTTSELAPLAPLPFTGIYAVTKTALDQYAAALRMELQLLGHPVIVLRPGAVDTGLLDESTRQLDRFCTQTTHYGCNAARFSRIVNRVEARKIPPERIAGLCARVLRSRHPRAVYAINRNPLLLLLNAVPEPLRRKIIRRLLAE